jgi:hypothetical protein
MGCEGPRFDNFLRFFQRKKERKISLNKEVATKFKDYSIREEHPRFQRLANLPAKAGTWAGLDTHQWFYFEPGADKNIKQE